MTHPRGCQWPWRGRWLAALAYALIAFTIRGMETGYPTLPARATRGHLACHQKRFAAAAPINPFGYLSRFAALSRKLVGNSQLRCFILLTAFLKLTRYARTVEQNSQNLPKWSGTGAARARSLPAPVLPIAHLFASGRRDAEVARPNSFYLALFSSNAALSFSCCLMAWSMISRVGMPPLNV